jgi:23S rRNA pseudouridine955/2504/2580 synthase
MPRKPASGKAGKTRSAKPLPKRHPNSQTKVRSSGQVDGVRQEVRRVTITEDNDGQRVDNFLLAQLRGVPKSIIYRIVRKGEVRVNKGRVKPDTRLKTGDQLRIPPIVIKEKIEKAKPGNRVQHVMEESIIFENEHMLVVNKPSGIAVHGGSGLSFGLIEVLRAARPEARFLELVHRLDRDTSGLVMVAKKRSALRYLQDELRERRIGKHYHALVGGSWSDSISRVDAPLLRYEMANGERRVKVDPAGKPSLTRFRCLAHYEGYSLVEASPVTGRTHQIRVHSVWAGHPIAGDDKYMDDVSLKAFRALGGQRLMLHAHALEFALPVTGEPIHLRAPYDHAFSGVLTKLGTRLTGRDKR